MRMTQSLFRDTSAIEARVTIKRPIQDVFRFYRDFKNLPRFLGDVLTVEQIGPAMSRWTIQGPLGIRTNWTVKVTDDRTNELIRYETVTPPGLTTYWEIYFASGPVADETEVREVMKTPFFSFGTMATMPYFN